MSSICSIAFEGNMLSQILALIHTSWAVLFVGKKKILTWILDKILAIFTFNKLKIMGWMQHKCSFGC
jgi:hypothetical protein